LETNLSKQRFNSNSERYVSMLVEFKQYNQSWKSSFFQFKVQNYKKEDKKFQIKKLYSEIFCSNLIISGNLLTKKKMKKESKNLYHIISELIKIYSSFSNIWLTIFHLIKYYLLIFKNNKK
jgi:hypothetical protein